MKAIITIIIAITLLASCTTVNINITNRATVDVERDSMMHELYEMEKLPMVYRADTALRREVMNKLHEKGYKAYNYSPQFNVGITQALQAYQTDNGLLMQDFANSGRVCPLTAEALGLEIDYSSIKRIQKPKTMEKEKTVTLFDTETGHKIGIIKESLLNELIEAHEAWEQDGLWCAWDCASLRKAITRGTLHTIE